jgi:XRE family aerobic/anaerobic benzoate catabolism transcriptional regulator
MLVIHPHDCNILPAMDDDLLRGIGASVQRLRAARSLSLEDLAERSALSPRFLSDIMAGRGNVSIVRLARLARALGTTASAMLAEAEGSAPAGPGIVALLGVRGAGKSTIGPRLARRLGVPFVELDARVEEQAGLSLSEIFATHGEAYFRRLEVEALRRLLSMPHAVVATGGGIIENRRRGPCSTPPPSPCAAPRRQRGALDAGRAARRPATDGGRPAAKAELRRLWPPEPRYRRARHRIDTERLGIAGSVRRIAERVQRGATCRARAEGAQSGRVMAICLHPYLIGVPHRIAGLDEAIGYIAANDGVWFATGRVPFVAGRLKRGRRRGGDAGHRDAGERRPADRRPEARGSASSPSGATPSEPGGARSQPSSASRSQQGGASRSQQSGATRARPSGAPRARTWSWGGAALVAAAAFAVYLNSLGGALFYDDVMAVLKNPLVHDCDVAWNLSRPSWNGGIRDKLWRPTATLTFAMNHALHGLAPFGYHLANVVLHAAVSVLVLSVLAAVPVAPRTAVAAALLFAVHPIHTEAVASVVGRAELLAAGGFLLAWWCCIAAMPPPGRRGWAWTAPRRSPTSSRCAARRSRWRSRPCWLADLLRQESRWSAFVRRAPSPCRPQAVTVGFVVLPEHHRDGQVTPTADLLDNPLVALLVSRLLTAVAVIGLYAYRLAFPLRLSADYSFDQVPAVTTPFDGGFLGGVAVLLVGIALGWWTWRRAPAVALGLAALGLTFTVVSNLFFLIGTIMGERLVYLPSAGFCLALAGGWPPSAASARGRAVCRAGGPPRSWLRSPSSCSSTARAPWRGTSSGGNRSDSTRRWSPTRRARRAVTASSGPSSVTSGASTRCTAPSSARWRSSPRIPPRSTTTATRSASSDATTPRPTPIDARSPSTRSSCRRSRTSGTPKACAATSRRRSRRCGARSSSRRTRRTSS